MDDCNPDLEKEDSDDEICYAGESPQSQALALRAEHLSPIFEEAQTCPSTSPTRPNLLEWRECTSYSDVTTPDDVTGDTGYNSATTLASSCGWSDNSSLLTGPSSAVTMSFQDTSLSQIGLKREPVGPTTFKDAGKHFGGTSLCESSEMAFDSSTQAQSTTPPAAENTFR